MKKRQTSSREEMKLKTKKKLENMKMWLRQVERVAEMKKQSEMIRTEKKTKVQREKKKRRERMMKQKTMNSRCEQEHSLLLFRPPPTENLDRVTRRNSVH